MCVTSLSAVMHQQTLPLLRPVSLSSFGFVPTVREKVGPYNRSAYFLSLRYNVRCSLTTTVPVSITCFTVITAQIVNINMSDYDTSVEDTAKSYTRVRLESPMC